MAMAAATSNKRARAKERRRQQLIDATIKCISKRGLGSMTLGDVAKETGLSQGIVNLHFESKDNLLNETLRSLAEEYHTQFHTTLQKSPPQPAQKLLALMEMDLKPSICDRRKLAVWFAFWGEVKAVPTYQKICDAYDRGYDEIIEGLCEQIIEAGDYRDTTADVVTEALTSMTNGLWLSCLISPRSFDRELARKAVYGYLKGVFPQHYQ